LDAGAVLMFDMPRTAEIRLTIHIHKFRYLRVRNYNGCKIYFNSFLAESQGFFDAFVDSFDYRVVISGHSGSYGNETNRFLRSLRSVEMTKAPRPRGAGGEKIKHSSRKHPRPQVAGLNTPLAWPAVRG